ncbi:hypothetical protein JOF53_004743 [Crossiella equi]|uniref:Uncharacterized protein n=1 Tax=Crossiella equi TaxID=130796 RepID=A0ABS5AH19_9PSEU|nr:hypothetical protein [Crossiella equi]MBP2475871.1 hypothetical protein [Crossiella equi]
MSHARRVGVLVLATAALLSSCVRGTVSGVAEAGDPVEAYDKRGSAPRVVPNPGGELVSLLGLESTGQLLCGALSAPEWSEVLGGPLQLRWVQRGGCQAEGGHQTVYASLSADQPCADVQPQQATTVGGLPGVAVTVASTREMLCVPLNHFGKEKADREKYGNDDARPKGTLHLTANPGENPPKPGRQILADLGERLVKALVKEGPSAPVPGEKGALPYTPFPPPGNAGVVDLPGPQRAAALCTAVTDDMVQSILGFPVRERQLTFGGDCTISGGEVNKGGAHTVWVQVISGTLEGPGSLYRGEPITVAGRPARMGSVLSGTGVLLQDGMANLLAVRLMALGDTRTDDQRRALERSLAEQLVPRLLGPI